MKSPRANVPLIGDNTQLCGGTVWCQIHDRKVVDLTFGPVANAGPSRKGGEGCEVTYSGPRDVWGPRRRSKIKSTPL